MSFNQSRGEKNEPAQYRRSGRSGNPAFQRNFSGGGGAKGGGSSTTAPPSSSSSRSYKANTNAQGVLPRVSSPNSNVNLDSSNSSFAGRGTIQNGSHLQPPPVRGAPDAPVTGTTIKPSDVLNQKSTPGLPKGNSVTPCSNATGPGMPTKGPADASRAFPLQFGSISPGLMNGMQIPARTSSAPPNMDEQKQAQARLDSLKATTFSTPAIPKQPPRKDSGPVDQSSSNEAHPVSKPKKNIQSSPAPAPPTIQTQKPSSHPIPMQQMSFHQPQLQMGPAQMPLPMPLPAQVQQQVFVPGIQHHPMQSQGIIHQGQGMNFTSQMGPTQMAPQLGNMGMGLGPQYPHQQTGKFGPRRTVKITHPETHEELRLDKRMDVYGDGGPSGQRSHPHGPPQAQPVPPFPHAHPMSHYSGSYNASPLFYPPPNSNPLTSAQITPGSQAAPRVYSQVTVRPAHGEKPGGSSLPASSPDKSEFCKVSRTLVESTLIHPQRDSEAITGNASQQSKSSPTSMANKPSGATFGSFPSESLANSSASSAPVEDSASNSRAEVAKRATIDQSGSFKEDQKKAAKKAQSIPPDQLPGQTLESSFSSETDQGVLETSKKVVSAADSTLKSESSEEGPKSTEISTETNSDSSHKLELPKSKILGSKEQGENVKTIDQKEDNAQEPVNKMDDKLSTSIPTSELNVLNAETASLNFDHPVSSSDSKNANNITNKEPVVIAQDSHTVSLSVPEATPSFEGQTTIINSKSKGSSSAAKGKKKRKEILKNADAQGTTSDLYMAYKGPEEKKETVLTEISEILSPQKASVDSSKKDEKRVHSKFEPDDWEDAADISTPKLLKHHSEEGNDGMTKRYSRDFLLKFSEQITGLPEGFDTSDIAEVFSRESYPSPGRPVDRPAGSSRRDDDKWNKNAGPIGHPGNATGFRPGQGGNNGVLRNPRGQTPIGIISVQMQSAGRNNADSDRWQRATGYQKGLIPSPQAPIMHKAERKYEVGKVTDEEQTKQRQLKGILNKLTPQNFEKLFEQVKQVNIDNAGTLSGVIAQIFDKAILEPTFCEMYANFCSHLSVELPDFSEDNEKITFKRLLLNKCQEEFERGEREQEEANRTEEEGEVKQSEEEREEKRVKARRRMLGNIRLIGELYKKKMLTERIMHECIKKLLGNYQNPDEEDIEALCKLMSTIGEMIDHPKAKEHMDAYFDMMFKLSNNMKLSSRVRFMLKDSIDLRKNKWQQRRKVEGPKKIEEVHRDAAQERQAQSSRLGRGPNLNSSLRRGQGQGQSQSQSQHVDFGPRGSNVLPSPNSQMGYRGLPQQIRGYGNQDARFEERQSFENRTLSIPLRPIGDDSITLGPQGGLARGMSMRLPGINGYGSGQREDVVPRYTPERFAPPHAYEHLNNMQDRSVNYVNRDTRNPERSFEQVVPSSPPSRAPQNVSSDKVYPEEQLHDRSMEAIKEYYSARDEKEVTQCIKDLNAPSFYPSMISIWVTDSFERKDMERDSLAKLLVNLAKPQLGMLSQDSLLKGFESVLSTLEDAVNDAPKAAEFLGRIFARVLLEDVVPYKELWRLIYQGGEEEGRLVEIGLAAEVLGVILEIIKTEKGDPFLNEICAGSNLEIGKFRPENIKKPLRLDKFII